MIASRSSGRPPCCRASWSSPTEDPSTSPAPIPVPPTVQTSDVPFPLQNFFYAFQWWIFAGFGVAVYLRWLWVESHRVEDDAVVT